MMARNVLAGCLVVAAAAALTGSLAASDQPAEPLPSWRSPAPDPARGAELAQVCLTCHVANSPQQNPPAPKLRHQRQSYLFFALLEYRDGKRQSDIMAPFASQLSDQDARDLAAYLSGAMHDTPPKARTDMPIYARTTSDCTWCHGETGIGEFESMPVLTGQDPAYLAAALKEYRAGLRTGEPAMLAIAGDLTDAEIEQLAQYYAAHDWLEHAQ